MRVPIAMAWLVLAPCIAAAQARLSTAALTPALTGQSVIAKAYPISGAALFVGYQETMTTAATFDRFGYRTLERPGPFDYASAAMPRFGAAGLLNEGGPDGLVDIAYLNAAGLNLVFGDQREIVHLPIALGAGSGTQPLSMMHLLATAGEVLVYVDSESITAIDFDHSGAIASQQRWTEAGSSALDDPPLALRLSPAARMRTGGVDIARSRVLSMTSYGIDLLWLQDAQATVLDSSLYTPLTVNLANAPVDPMTPRGVGALDVDGDGVPDLVVDFWDGDFNISGKLKWLKNDGDPAHLQSALLQEFPAQLGIRDPRLLRPVDLDGTPAMALWDAGGSGSIVVVTAEGGQLRTWRGPAMSGRVVYDLVAGDVVGSPLADLVVVYVDPQQVMPAAIQIFPDSGDAFPTVSWSPSQPACALQGADLPLKVNAADDGSVAQVEWFVNGTAAAVASQSPYPFTLPASTADRVQVTARAVDNVGLWSEVTTIIPLLGGAPALRLPAGERVSIQLTPGGTQAPLSAQATDPCGGQAAVQWLLARIAPGATAAVQGDQLAIPEEAYPALLASADLTISVTAQASLPGGSTSAAVQLTVDASGLLQVEQSSDRALLAPGDLALLTTTLRSRLVSVALPKVRIDDRFEGLEAAGPLQVEGATVFTSRTSTGYSRVTLDQIAPGGVPVTIRQPVRRTLAAGGQSRVQALASGGAPLSPLAAPQPVRRTPPGTGCGQEGSGAFSFILLIVAGVVAGRIR